MKFQKDRHTEMLIHDSQLMEQLDAEDPSSPAPASPNADPNDPNPQLPSSLRLNEAGEIVYVGHGISLSPVDSR